MNKRIRVVTLGVGLLLGGAAMPALAGAAETGDGGLWGRLTSGRDVPPITNERYRSECGGCHFAYQPGLLPAAAWGRIMGSLDDHFGDDASLDPSVAQELRDYLTVNAANESRSIRSRAFAAAPIPAAGTPRISQTRYFHRRHDRIPPRLVKDNPKVKSFSGCQSCHRGAEAGRFNGGSVVIPGAEDWDG